MEQPRSHGSPVVYASVGHRDSQYLRCPHCRAEVVTDVQYEPGTFAMICCMFLCIIGCDAGCCLIPFCVEDCQDRIHYCPHCRQLIRRSSRM